MSAITIVPRPVELQAVQFTGHNIAEVTAFAPDHCQPATVLHEGAELQTLFVRAGNGACILAPTDWLVNLDGAIIAVPHGTVAEAYMRKDGAPFEGVH